MGQNSKKRKIGNHVEDNAEPVKRCRLTAGYRQIKKPKKPQLPRPKQPLTFTIPKQLLQGEPPTSRSMPNISSKTQSFRSGSSTPTKPTTDPPLLRLHKVNILLTSIHRRNKNQHRNQPFYRHLSLLRRSVKKLIGLHEQSAVLTSKAPDAATSAADVRQRFERESQFRSQCEILEEHVRETVVPSAYVAFSGVVADTQFANLGVVLLGVLADVVGVVGLTRQVERTEKVGVKSSEKSVGGRLVGFSTLVTGPDQGVVVQRVYDSDGEKRQAKKQGCVQEDVDMGEVVSRDESDVTLHGMKNSNEEVTEKARNKDISQIGAIGKDTSDTLDDIKSDQEEQSTSPITARDVDSGEGTSSATPGTQTRLQPAPNRTSMPLLSTSKSTPSPAKGPQVVSGNITAAFPDQSRNDTSQTISRMGKSENNDSKYGQGQGKEKQTKRKSKKKGNAIDDLFSGFG